MASGVKPERAAVHEFDKRLKHRRTFLAGAELLAADAGQKDNWGVVVGK